jgi:methyl-accepting chemotaxis protein
MAQQYKRRNYFIDRSVQGRFIAGFTAASLAGGIVAVFCFRYFAGQKLEATLYAMRLPDVPMAHLLLQEMLITTALTAIFVLLLFWITAGKVFARIDGPLRRMAGALRNITGGDLHSGVRLRENDEFQEFAADVESMVRQMNGRFAAVRLQAEKIGALCSSPEAAAEEHAAAQIRELINAMKKEIQVFTV